MPQLLQISLSLILTFSFAWLLTYLLVRLAGKSQNDEQKKKPAFGGLAIFLSFWLNYFLFRPFSLGDEKGVLFIGSGIILITGILDDWLDLSPLYKSMGILLAIHYVYFLGDFSFSSRLIMVDNPILLAIITYLLTLTWIYFVTNAVNLLDGIDGLAASVSMVSLSSLVVITWLFSLTLQWDFLVKLLLLICAIGGFSCFNWPPAKIMLGDTGALFIGFMYASLTVTNLKHASLFSLIFPILLFAVPLFDTFFAFFRRLIQGQSVTQGDREHIHHRLLRRGWKESRINILMMGISLGFSVIALLLHIFNDYKWLILTITLLILLVMIHWVIDLGKGSKS